MGYSAIVLRGPVREALAAGGKSGAASAFEVGPTIQASGAGRRMRKPGATLPGVASTASSAGLPMMQIDSGAVADVDPVSRAGRSIALTLSHLRERRFGAVHWHQHQDRLWSADLHGYAAARGRGAYRLMVSHLGGSRYRVEGVRQPHRR